MLAPQDLEAWRAGRIPFLERAISGNLTKLARIQKAVRRVARERGLVRRAGSVGGPRFSKNGHPFVEGEYRARRIPHAGRRPERGPSEP